jgi:hypothetical protein
MKIDDCKTCKNHVMYQNGYVICNYWNMQEQRVTGTRDGMTYLIACPREEENDR